MLCASTTCAGLWAATAACSIADVDGPQEVHVAWHVCHHAATSVQPSKSFVKGCVSVCFGPEKEITWDDGICFLTDPLQACAFHMLRFSLPSSLLESCWSLEKVFVHVLAETVVGRCKWLFIDQKR